MNDMVMKAFQAELEKQAFLPAARLAIGSVARWAGKKLASRPFASAVEGIAHDSPAFMRKAKGGDWMAKIDDNGAILHPKKDTGSFKADLLLNTALSAPAVYAARNAGSEAVGGPSVAEYSKQFKQYI